MANHAQTKVVKRFMDSLLEQITEIVGSAGILTGSDVSSRADNWPPEGGCQAKAIVRPVSTEQVSAVMKLCHAQNQTVVTHGGLTGLVKGAIANKEDIVISLERMRELEPIDVASRSVIAQAGVVLQQLHEAAAEVDLLFPLDLGARGSCTIGGNISTNAGGNSVIRYGMMRNQVLGIEAVMADGTVISSLNNVIKNNTGYDLKQLFIGSEGTLGIVTRAVLRLWPLPRSRQTALVAIDHFENVGQFLGVMDASLGGTLSAFEVLWNDFYTLIVANTDAHGLPLSADHAFYVLLESTGSHEDIDNARFERALENAFEQELIVDAVVAQSQQQREDLWAIRDDIEGLVANLEPAITYDISLTISRMDQYVKDLRSQLEQQWPDYAMVVFGHLGDGNIHLVICIGSSSSEDVRAVDEVVYRLLKQVKGVISAEHGIGLSKKEFLPYSRDKDEMKLMKTLKFAMDPKNILNPEKIFSSNKVSEL
jgi:FAD/FMN-containing dehydrogenase